MAGAIDPVPFAPSDGLRNENTDGANGWSVSRGGSRQVYIVVSGTEWRR
jgi:hypothetical protein